MGRRGSLRIGLRTRELIGIVSGFWGELMRFRYWAGYNELLRSITDEGHCGPVVIAKRCGHFIQKDHPEFVAREVRNMLERLEW